MPYKRIRLVQKALLTINCRQYCFLKPLQCQLACCVKLHGRFCLEISHPCDSESGENTIGCVRSVKRSLLPRKKPQNNSFNCKFN